MTDTKSDGVIYIKHYDIPREVYDRFQAILNGTREWEDEGDSVTVFSIAFDEGWEIAFSCVPPTEKPYLDVILFQNGEEVWGWEISDSLLGCWETVMGGYINAAFRVETFVES